MKKYALILCTGIMLNILSSSTYAQSYINSEPKQELLFPVSYIAQKLGGSISWNKSTRTATITYNDRVLELKIGSKTIISNGRSKNLNNEVKISGGRTVLPVQVLNDELGTELTEEDCLNFVGRTFIDLLNENKINDASALLSKTFSKYLTPTNLQLMADSISVLHLDDKKAQYWSDSIYKIIGIQYENEEDNFYAVKFDSEGKIDELGSIKRQTQASQSPDYTSENNFTETEVTFGTGVWRLPGTLTLPEGNGPFPVVILVHDSGPNDRDETTGYLKPFRDLAYGLAERNIAVFRYDKRTLVHNTKVKLIGNMTLNEEIEQDVYTAAEYLKTVNKIDKNRIVPLGHSLGGYALPQILKTGAETFRAGIIMNGSTRPQYELLPEYMEYLYNKGIARKSHLDYVNTQVEILKSESFDFTNPPEDYTMGNEYYYNYMKNYDAIGLAQALDKPLLVMQGKRDFIVNPAVDFENWKSALKNNKKADFRLYPDLNHMFTEGKGDSTPAEYYMKNNIPEYVIKDIADFIDKLE